MFGRSRPVVFDPYPDRRSRRRLPAWLVTALLGIAIGAGGVILVQERYMPPRLSAEQSQKLQAMLERSEADRKRLADELGTGAKALGATEATNKALSDELAAIRRKLDEQRSDVASLLEALPPDPRDGVIAVRAGRFSEKDGALSYHVVLSRDKSSGKPFTGVMQFVVAGIRGGSESSVTLKPIDVSFSDYDSLHGSVPLPENFDPKQTTVRVLDRAGGKQLGMRVLYVQ